VELAVVLAVVIICDQIICHHTAEILGQENNAGKSAIVQTISVSIL
jgi:hypothetical protein